MKKFALTAAIVLAMGLGAYAQGGLLGFGSSSDEYNPSRDGNGLTTPTLPAFGETTDQEGTTPLGSGIAVLMGLGAAYAFSKKRKD